VKATTKIKPTKIADHVGYSNRKRVHATCSCLEREKELNQIIRPGGAVQAEIGMLKAQSPSDWLKHA
jgi:hypothetical protein